jgi:lysyl-tRNA synthetase class 2
MIEQRIVLDRAVREFFWSLDYQEVRTPLLVRSPGMEPHIRPIELKRPFSLPPVFLPTSPEFGMKKLLAKGLPRIFQICSAFRDEPRSPEHHPEFTMLEFYEANLPLEGLQDRVEALFNALCERIHHSESFSYQGRTISLQTPFKHFRVVDLFLEHLKIDLRSHQTASMLAKICEIHQIQASADESWDDLYFRLWLNLIEPKLPKNEAYFITHYPLSQSSLCNPIADETGFKWANRFEVYIGQTELGNAFDELRDAPTQKKNFEKDQEIRKSTYGDAYTESPIDDELLAALPLMKPTTGIAIGLDRLAMLLLDAKTIEEVLYLESFW